MQELNGVGLHGITHHGSNLVTSLKQAIKFNTGSVFSFMGVNHLKTLYEWLVLMPLSRLYLYGPTLNGWGFWGGQEVSLICAQQTSLNVNFWRENEDQCYELISKQFQSITVLVETVMYFLCIFSFLKFLLNLVHNQLQRKQKK